MMKKLLILITFSLVTILVGCSSKDTTNPYKESHITDVIHNYQITPSNEPTLAKPIEEMTQRELLDRYGELQNTTGKSPAQETEFRRISDRLKGQTQQETNLRISIEK